MTSMKISIVIVNYNVKHFLEHAIIAAKKALNNQVFSANSWKGEIIVVDNQSVDGSVKMIKDKFGDVTLIENKENKGFATANNQAIREANGEYILLLNPDTLVEEDTFAKTIEFMDAHPDAGALGVRMIDGQGKFLPESKRGLPTPETAFYKIFGFSRLFPRSKIFGKYHLGYLSEDELHEVDVLSGAFMLLRKKVLDKIGLLDEDFFMYGEDIDLSTRIINAGYKNYYFPDAHIIHYKGESTGKGSLNYVRIFYKAMIIFARKHYSQRKAGLFIFLIQLAVYFRAFIAVIYRISSRILLPITDALILFGGMYILQDFWARTVKETYYPFEYVFIVVPVYIVIWLTSMYLSGGYDKPVRMSKIVRGLVIGTIVISIMHGFINEHWRFSRFLIILGMVMTVFSIGSFRLFLHFIKTGNFKIDKNLVRKVAIVGYEQESKRVNELLNQQQINYNLIGNINPSNDIPSSNNVLGTLDQLKDITEIYHINEVIYCAKDTSTQQIISSMAQTGSGVAYKIIPEESLNLLGSNSKNQAGDLITFDINLQIDTIPARRNKRLIDLLLGGLLLVSLPVNILFIKNRAKYLSNLVNVVIGKFTWVGYSSTDPSNLDADFPLPHLKPGVLSPVDDISEYPKDANTISRLDLLYAKDYSMWQDVNIIFRNISKLGK